MKSFFFFLFFAALLSAAEFEVQYSVSYWFLGRIGTTHLQLSTDKKHYRIEATAKLEGIAALIARHHQEHHVSTGSIDKDRRLIPHHYDVNKTLDRYQNLRHYYYEPRQKRILLQEAQTWESTSRTFSLDSMHFITKNKTEHNTAIRLLTYYCEDDLLTLYFNARAVLKLLNINQSTSFKAVGARHGDVTVMKLKEPNRFAVTLHQDIFKSKDGRLLVETDDETFVKSAVLKDVLLFGDLEVEREWIKRSP